MPYSDVIRAVQRYRPTNLIPFLAAHSAEREHTLGPSEVGQWFPWAISGIAKESVLTGDEFRRPTIDASGLALLVKLFNGNDYLGPGRSAASMLAPIFYEQFPYQESVFEEMARTHALLVESEPDQAKIPWEDALGLSLDQAMRASHVLHSWAIQDRGRHDKRVFYRTDMQEFYDRVAARDEILTTAALLTSDIHGLRVARANADQKAAIPESLERYAFNPLRSHPLVDLGRAGVWAPQTMFVSRAFLGPNLYYRGLDAWGKAYADGLGDRTQRYVGRQLKLLPGIALHPEITYASGKQSIDWIWVSDSAVILIECKAARMSIDAQAGGATFAKLMQRYLGEARRQIDTTAKLIQYDHPAFDRIPKDRPIVGLVTTAEPFYLAGTPFQGFSSTGTIPVTNLSLRDLEVLVTLSEPEAASLVISHAHPDGEGGRFGGAFDDATRKRRNPILERAWRAFDFLDTTLEEGR